MEQLSPHATTIKPVLQNPGATATEPTTLQPHKSACARAYALQQEKPNDEKPALQLESSPCSLWQKKSLSSNKDPAQPKIIHKYTYIKKS